jgi:hypothetical protein
VASAAERAALNESLEEPDDERLLRTTTTTKTTTRPQLSLEISDTYDDGEGIEVAPVRQGRRLVGSLSGRPRAPPFPKPPTAGTHDKVRMEALKMLQLADEKTLPTPYALRKTQSGGWTSSSRNAVSGMPTSQSSNLAGLDMALGARETKDRYRVSPISNNDDMEGVDEDDYDDDELTRRRGGRVDSSLRTKQQQRDPMMDEILIEEEEPTKPSNWSSRYSVDHHLMAITGGANAAEMLNKMDRAHYSNKKSARNMFKSSPHESGSGFPSFRFGSGSGSFAANGIPSMGWRSDDATHGRRTSYLRGLFSGWSLSSLRRKKQFTPKGSGNGGQTIWTDVDMRLAGPRTVVEEEKYRRRLQRMVVSSVCLCLMIVVLVIVYQTVDVHGRGSGIRGPAWAKVGSPVTFYVTANVPFNEFDAKVLTRSLTSLPSGTDFVVHLGDVHSVAETECNEDVYQQASTIFKESRAPVFVLPGNNDWNDCRDPKTAWKNWNTYLNRFEENFRHNFKVDRQLGRTENFAFLHQGVLFIGLHLVDGTVVNQADETIRHAQDVAWTEQKLHAYNVNDFRAVVLMGHSKPNAQVSGFFSQVVDELAATGKPTIYMYAARTVTQTFIEYKPFVSAPQMMAARIEEGGSNGPTKVTIGFGTDPFFFAEQTSS